MSFALGEESFLREFQQTLGEDFVFFLFLSHFFMRPFQIILNFLFKFGNF